MGKSPFLVGNQILEAVAATAAVVTTAAAAAAATGAGGAGGSGGSGLSSFSGMGPGSVPSGLPQPGTGNLINN